MFKPEDLKYVSNYSFGDIRDYLDTKFHELVKDQWYTQQNTNFIYISALYTSDIGQAIEYHKTQLKVCYEALGWSTCSITTSIEPSRPTIIEIRLDK